MIEASFEAVVPKAINAEFEAVIPREKAFDIVNKDIHIDTNGKYEVKADAGTAMTQVNVEVDIQPKEFKDVNFYDYEGTILHSYTWDEFVEKNEMPPLPTHHKGLVCQEWNYTLEEVLEQGGRCDVGAIYIPEDGASHVIIELSKINTEVTLDKKSAESVTIDWGDGTVEEYLNGTTLMTHTYDVIGEIDIRITGLYTFFGTNSQNKGFITPNVCKKVFIGEEGKLSDAAFVYCSIMNGLTLPSNFKKLYAYICNHTAITHCNIPRNCETYIYVFSNAPLKTISIPDKFSINNTGSTFFSNTIEKLHIPNNCSVIGNILSPRNLQTISVGRNNQNIKENAGVVYRGNEVIVGTSGQIIENATIILPSAFNGNLLINELILPATLTTIRSTAFQQCFYLSGKVVLPKNLLTIEPAAFYQDYRISFFDFSKHEEIPMLGNSNAFGGTSAKFVVPDALYDQWIVATNWATYKSRIVKASEFVEPTN